MNKPDRKRKKLNATISKANTSDKCGKLCTTVAECTNTLDPNPQTIDNQKSQNESINLRKKLQAELSLYITLKPSFDHVVTHTW